MKRRGVIIIAVIVLLIAVGIFLAVHFSKGDANFTKTSLFRVSIPLGGEYLTSLKITNYEKSVQDFTVDFNDFEDLANLSETEFLLEPGEIKNIDVLFQDDKGVPGIYVGKLVISTSSKKEEIPVILGVEDSNAAFAIIQNSIPKYDSVYPGGKLGVEIKVYDLIGSTVQTIDSNYLIKNLEDDILFTGEGNLIVGGGSKTELVTIPMDWKKGDYVFIVSIDYKNTTSFSSYLFTISEEQENFVTGNFEIFIIIIIVFVLLFFGAIVYFVKTRDDLILQLKKQQYSEIKRNVRFIDSSKRKVLTSEKKGTEKKKKLHELNNLKKKILARLKEKQKGQKTELKKLIKKSGKKKGARNSIKSKVENWKNQGYKMFETEEEIKNTPHKGIKDELKEWKKKGYTTDFLSK